MLCNLHRIPPRLHTRLIINFKQLFLYLCNHLSIMGSYPLMEVNIIIILRLARKKIWPTDYEKVMITVKRKLFAQNIFR